MDISKKDWKLFRERLKPASEKFWELEKRIKEDKRHPGVVMELKNQR